MNGLSRTQKVGSVVFTMLLLCSTFAVGVVAAEEPTPEDVSPDDVEVDHVYMAVNVDDAGDARWVVEYRVLLESDEDRAQFDLVRDSVAENPDEYEQEFGQYTNLVFVSATETVDREMSMENRTVDTREIRDSYGVIQYEFTWTNFANVSETDEYRTMEIGDTIETMRFGSDTRFELSWDSKYTMTSIAPVPDDSHVHSQVTWSGPLEFDADSGEPRVILEHELDTNSNGNGNGSGWGPNDPNGGTNGENNAGNGESEPESNSMGPIIIALVIAVSGMAAVVFYVRRESRPDGVHTPETGVVSDDSRPEDAGGVSDAEDAADDTMNEEEEEESVDFALLSNEEQVLHLLDENNGRMKQQAIVQETGWSPAKTSGVVNDMKDEGLIDVFRLGRENIVAKPDDSDDN